MTFYQQNVDSNDLLSSRKYNFLFTYSYLKEFLNRNTGTATYCESSKTKQIVSQILLAKPLK